VAGRPTFDITSGRGAPGGWPGARGGAAGCGGADGGVGEVGGGCWAAGCDAVPIVVTQATRKTDKRVENLMVP